MPVPSSVTRSRLLAGLAAAGVAAAIALTPTSQSDAQSASTAKHRADVAARHLGGRLHAVRAER